MVRKAIALPGVLPGGPRRAAGPAAAVAPPAGAGTPERRVLIEFSRPRRRPERRASRSPPAAGLPAHPRKAMPGLRVPEGRRLATPPAAGAPAEPARRATALPEMPAPAGSIPAGFRGDRRRGVAEPDQILRRRLRGHRAEPAAAIGGRADGAAAAAETAADPAAALETAGYTPTTALEWKAGGRTLLLPPRLGFPELLLEKGLEVDVEAAFVVAPSGQVTRVRDHPQLGFRLGGPRGGTGAARRPVRGVLSGGFRPHPVPFPSGEERVRSSPARGPRRFVRDSSCWQASSPRAPSACTSSTICFPGRWSS